MPNFDKKTAQVLQKTSSVSSSLPPSVGLAFKLGLFFFRAFTFRPSLEAALWYGTSKWQKVRSVVRPKGVAAVHGG